MKLIKEVPLWDNGKIEKATVLHAYATNVSLDKSATFWYGLINQTEDGRLAGCLTQGNVFMSESDYGAWESDDVAWNFIASKLNLEILGDFVETQDVAPSQEETSEVEGEVAEETGEEPADIAE